MSRSGIRSVSAKISERLIVVSLMLSQLLGYSLVYLSSLKCRAVARLCSWCTVSKDVGGEVT